MSASIEPSPQPGAPCCHPTGAPEASATIYEALNAEADPAHRRVPFDRFMHWALYHPREGYYAASGGGPAGPFGSQGDFVTAPALGPWFAGAVAEAFVRVAEQAPDPGHLVIRELGAGDGRLVADLLSALQRRGCLPSRYEVWEPSPAMRALQRKRVDGLSDRLRGCVHWLDVPDQGMPPVQGLILANEVADALPVKVFEWSGEDAPVWEWGVAIGHSDATTSGITDGVEGELPLGWVRWPAPEPLRQVVKARQSAQQTRGLNWASGHRGEWCPGLTGWAQSLANALAFGELLIVDYGYEQYELDHPDRSGGTLAAHRRHRRMDAWPEIIDQPGRQDITAHVDFTEIAQAFTQAGLDLRLQTQAAWLLDHGVLAQAEQRLFDTAGSVGQPPSGRYELQALSGLQTLLSDAAMGQSFLVLSGRRGLFK